MPAAASGMITLKSALLRGRVASKSFERRKRSKMVVAQCTEAGFHNIFEFCGYNSNVGSAETCLLRQSQDMHLAILESCIQVCGWFVPLHKSHISPQRSGFDQHLIIVGVKIFVPSWFGTISSSGNLIRGNGRVVAKKKSLSFTIVRILRTEGHRSGFVNLSLRQLSLFFVFFKKGLYLLSSSFLKNIL